MTDFSPQTPPDAIMAQRPGNGMAVASLVLGIIAIPIFCIWYVSIPCAVLAIIFGVVGRGRAKAGARGSGLATGGLVCGCISIGLLALCFILALAGIAVLGSQAPGFFEALQQAAEQAQQGATTAPAP